MQVLRRVGPRCVGPVPPLGRGGTGQQGEPAPWSRGWRKAIGLQDQSQAAGRIWGLTQVPCSEQGQVGDGGWPWESEFEKSSEGAKQAWLLWLTLQGELGDKV